MNADLKKELLKWAVAGAQGLAAALTLVMAPMLQSLSSNPSSAATMASFLTVATVIGVLNKALAWAVAKYGPSPIPVPVPVEPVEPASPPST